MKKQHIEGVLSKSLKKYNKENTPIWYLKLHNNPLTHKTTPADFLILTENHNYLVECKETKSQTFTLDRMTQKDDLQHFKDKFNKNFSLLLLCFWKGTIKKSEIYLVDINHFLNTLTFLKKKSININDARDFFKCNLLYAEKGGEINLRGCFI